MSVLACLAAGGLHGWVAAVGWAPWLGDWTATDGADRWSEPCWAGGNGWMTRLPLTERTEGQNRAHAGLAGLEWLDVTGPPLAERTDDSVEPCCYCGSDVR